MNLVYKEEEVTALVQNVKDQGGSLLTNFFSDSEKISIWVKNQQLYYKPTKSGVLFFRENESFYHLYYYSTSLENLQHLITHHLPKVQVVVDIIGKVQSITNLIELFHKAGFKLHTQLHRYIRMNNTASNYYALSKEVSEAILNDAAEITELFKENFDRLSDQVPAIDDVRKLIQDKKVLIIRDNTKIKGFLVRTFTGLTTTLNNFLVHKSFRGEKVGSKLLKHYIFESIETKRMILWVIFDNDVAINVYKNHGYLKDDLADFILIK